MNLQFTTLEKRSIAKVLTNIVTADGIIADGEVNYLKQLQLTLGISFDDLEQSNQMNVMLCTETLKQMSMVKKQAVVIMMHQMILADGDVDENEIKVFIAVCALADLPLPDMKK